MNARPDVPDTPDRTDAIARMLSPLARELRLERRQARNLLATDDPAAVAALAANLAERHPDALLNALTNAGVLHGEMQVGYGSGIPAPRRRLVTPWREVQQP